MPKIANWIVIGVLAVTVLLGGGVVGASAAGMFSPAPGHLDPASYVDPPPSPRTPEPGLDAPDTSVAPDAATIQQRLAALSRRGLGTVSYQVIDMSGQKVAGEDEDTLRIPASSWKVLTSMAVLSAYGSNHRFTTTVVSSPSGIVLVGAGDPYLTRSSAPEPGQGTIQDLAAKTAEALGESGTASVTVGYDDSLFAPPQWNPLWPAIFGADVSPISALSVDPDGWSGADTSADAAKVFGAALSNQGITVTDIRSEKAGTDATLLASEDSLPLGTIVQHVLSTSYNFGAEVLLRHVGVAAGGDGSTSSGASGLAAYLQSQDLWADGMRIDDGSGLSSGDTVSASILAQAVRTAYGNSLLADILTGIPVAGVDGTLARRFDDPDEADGRGVVHAKTGTLDNVRTLTGFAQTSSGAVVFFSFMLNNLPDSAAGLDWLDEAAAILAS